MTDIGNTLQSGGLVMIPLILSSLILWAVIFERLWRYRKMGPELRSFQLEVMNRLLRNEVESIRVLCAQHPKVPTARIVSTALERLSSKDERLRERWYEAYERRRLLENQELRSHLWLLGTIGSSAPFIGLAGTVVGILRSFNDIAKTGAGGFAVVASGISSALIATASGIIIAIIAVVAYNAFQTRWSGLVLTIKIHSEEIAELLNGSVTKSGH